MKRVAAIGTVLLMSLASTPAFALFCHDEGPSIGFSAEFNKGRFGRPTNNQLQQEQDLSRLRSAGIEAQSTERWNGCIRAFVTTASGGQSMEFYDPRTLQRLQ